MTLEQELERSVAIYTGVVLTVEPHPSDPNWWVRVGLRPVSMWRGEMAEILYVVTPINEAACGVHFEIGTEYLVFAYPAVWPGSDPSTHLCGRTHATYPGDPDIAALGPPIATPAVAPTWGALKIRYR
ncbi:MAG TPA: hypothetical protein VEY91_10230 [Candidatus Limnocylindria bacterium]|nr:hypothetical protein [Candidatus Limnocylindria bacterium]